jgi:hypothetical protein
MRRFKNNYRRKTEISRHRDTAEIESRLSRLVKTDQAEELPRERPELEAFGLEWVRAWAPHARERLVEIAKALRKYPWMVGVVRQKPENNPHPYMVEVYVAVDGSEVCLSLNQLRAYCAQNGAVREVKLELAFSRYEVYEDKIREVYRPKGLLAFTTAAREYVRPL